MLTISKMTPSAAPVSNVSNGVLRFMSGPTETRARGVQFAGRQVRLLLVSSEADATAPSGRPVPAHGTQRTTPATNPGYANIGSIRSLSHSPHPGVLRQPG